SKACSSTSMRSLKSVVLPLPFVTQYKGVMSGTRAIPPIGGLGGISCSEPFLEAAAHCDRLADEIMKLRHKVYNLQAAVFSAMKSDSGHSLANALTDKASLVSYSAGVIRDAVTELRLGAQQLTKAQVDATNNQFRQMYGGGR